MPVLAACAAIAADTVKAATVADLTFVPGVGTGWAFYLGDSPRNGGPAGEWTARVNGRPAVGYFNDPRGWVLTSGVITNLSNAAGAYKASWLIEEYALGLSHDGLPPDWSGGAVSQEEKRTALSLAIFEVCLSPESDPHDLGEGFFRLWYAPSAVCQQLAQAYLNTLTNAAVDEAALEGKYDIIVGDQWLGELFSRWIAVIEPQILTRVHVAPPAVDLTVGQNMQFSAAGEDQAGFPMPLNPVWSATGGLMDGDGLYLATLPGGYDIMASATGSLVTGTGRVNVVAASITEVQTEPQVALSFASCTTTVYTLQQTGNLMAGEWAHVPGGGPERGLGVPMTLMDTNANPGGHRAYRLLQTVTPGE